MNLLEELQAVPATECRICTYLSDSTPEVRAQWEQALAYPVRHVPNVNVVTAMRKRGVLLTEASVRRHRKNHAAS